MQLDDEPHRRPDQVKGPFLDAGDSSLAIAGGTGRYRKARGTMKLHSLENGNKFAFEFHLGG